MKSAANRTVHHDMYAKALQRIKAIHLSERWITRPENLRMYGASGVGKSTLLKAYRDAHPPRALEDRTIVPVVYCIVPPMPTPKRLMSELLHGIGVSDPDRGTCSNQISRFLMLCRESRVELVLIDEAQHFVDRGSLRTHTAVADLLKVLFEKLDRPAVMAGAPRMAALFTVNNQLRRRFSGSYTLRPFNLDDLFSAFRGFVHSLAHDLPQRDRDWLASSEVARLLFYATDGIPSNLVDLLRQVEGLATVDGLSLPDLSRAFRRVIYEFPPPGTDPFLKEFRFTRLNQSGEPFEPSLLDGDNHDGAWTKGMGGKHEK